MKKLLRGGFVVTPRGSRRADVLLDGEKIAQVGHISPAEAKSAEVTDVSGCYLFPGFIDAHTHFDLDVCNTTTADDFASGTRSAIRGGTTTIIDFACPNKGETLAYGLDIWHKKADGKCSCDYGFHMTIDDWNEGIEGELDDMFAAGITSFKMYLTYPAMMIGDGAVYAALKALKKRGGIAGVHCENAGVIDARIAELKAAGRAADVSAHPEARPDYLEAEAVARLLRIAEAADAPVVIVHLTNREALDEVAFARARGQRVYVETCPQYLALDDGVYYDANWSMAARYVCAPPIRAEVAQMAAEVCAIDISDEMVRHLKEKIAEQGVGNVSVSCMDLFDESLRPGSFDAVVACNVLLYLENRAEVLARIRELLRPEGMFLSATDCLGERLTREGVRKWWRSHTGEMPYVSFDRMHTLEASIAAAGFEVLETENLFPAPPNLFVAARKK